MSRLTEPEQQEIIRFLEADKPLPEKYRFLLFEDKREVELVWNGKTSEVSNIVLPFQVIEQVDEPRAETPEDTEAQLSLFDERGRQLKRLDEQTHLGRQQAHPLQPEERPAPRGDRKAQGGLKLIYIDPPFRRRRGFQSMDIEIGRQHLHQERPNILEEIAYRDTWGKGVGFPNVAMMYERLVTHASIYFRTRWKYLCSL